MNEKITNLQLSENEIAVLTNLIDGAVKFFGLQAAASAAHFQQKILAAKKAPDNTIKTGE